MSLAHDQGAVFVHLVGEDTPLVLKRSQYESLQAAACGGADWWEGEGLYGSTILVRLELVAHVHDSPPGCIEHALEDNGINEDGEPQGWT